MKRTIVDGIRKIGEPDTIQELLVECEWCGAAYARRHRKFTSRCVECGKRAVRYADCKCQQGKRSWI